MQVKITYMDNTPDKTTETTQALADITTLLNTDRFVTIGTITTMSTLVKTVEVVTAQ
jgi:hypothetical protein